VCVCVCECVCVHAWVRACGRASAHPRLHPTVTNGSLHQGAGQHHSTAEATSGAFHAFGGRWQAILPHPSMDCSHARRCRSSGPPIRHTRLLEDAPRPHLRAACCSAEGCGSRGGYARAACAAAPGA